jgi:predicted AlkP superfamily phosphohydrolase/phosphomutase
MALRDIFKKKKGNRSCVVGLDGVPHSLVMRFVEDGTWPFMAGLVKSGSLTRMKVTLPEISAVSWPSFMTGANPGVHGVFGFTELDGDYNMSFTNFQSLKCPTFWDRLGEQGKKSVVINQPGTYPARDIPGVLISGFVAIELHKSVKPMRHLATLRRNNYEIDIDTQRCRKDHNQLFVELKRTLDSRRAVVEKLWKDEEWDYFQIVITGTDRLQHYVFPAILDPEHQRHEQAIDYYRRIDGFVKEMWERHHASVDVSREGEGFFMLSDHGFCAIDQEVYVNAWLKEQGYLKFDNEDPKGLGDISSEGKAFALDPGRIYIHRKGKYKKGQVEYSDADALISEIKEKLGALCYHDQQVIETVKLRDEAYQGPETENGPDLVAVANHGFDLKGMPGAREVFGRSDLTGMHTWDDAFFWSLETPGDDLCIDQLADIVTSPLKT